MSPPLSRRRFLALSAAGGVAPLTGCSTTDRSADTAEGPVWQKKVQVERTEADSSVLTDVLRLQFDPDRDEVFGAVDPAYVDGAVDGASVTVSPELHDALTTEFGQVNYRVKLGPVNDAGDHLHARARRTAFNDLPLAGRASVETFWVRVTDDLRVRYVRPTETAPPDRSPATAELDRLDLGGTADD